MRSCSEKRNWNRIGFVASVLAGSLLFITGPASAAAEKKYRLIDNEGKCLKRGPAITSGGVNTGQGGYTLIRGDCAVLPPAEFFHLTDSGIGSDATDATIDSGLTQGHITSASTLGESFYLQLDGTLAPNLKAHLKKIISERDFLRFTVKLVGASNTPKLIIRAQESSNTPNGCMTISPFNLITYPLVMPTCADNAPDLWTLELAE
jgi:hypothetical protein